MSPPWPCARVRRRSFLPGAPFHSLGTSVAVRYEACGSGGVVSSLEPLQLRWIRDLILGPAAADEHYWYRQHQFRRVFGHSLERRYPILPATNTAGRSSSRG